MDEEVIIVGAGPTGLMLACELKLMGASVTVIDQRPHGTSGESRAPGINARSMEIFAQRGLAGKFRATGRPMPMVLFSGMAMRPGTVDPAWPDALILPQHETERILAERAVELGVAIRWSTAFTHLAQDADGVDLIVQTAGKAALLRARYLVGCDGGSSAVRRACNISFEGEDPLSHWVVADAQLDSPPSDNAAFGRNTQVGTYQVSWIEPDWYRISLMRLGAPPDSRAAVTLEELRQVMLAGIGTDYGLRSARWMSRFTDGFRHAGQYRHGRVLLAGDAAHTHSPIGGQGLNLGIQDAVNLGWKLAAIICHGSSEALLDTYHDERYPVAQAVLEMARAQTVLIKPGHQTDALRNVVAKMLDVAEVMMEFSAALSGLGIRYPCEHGAHPLVGRRMPNMPISANDGSPDVYSLMTGGRPLWLQFGESAGSLVPEPWASRVDCVTILPPKGEATFNWDFPVIGRAPAIRNALVRPDGHVAYVTPMDAPGETASASLIKATAHWPG